MDLYEAFLRRGTLTNLTIRGLLGVEPRVAIRSVQALIGAGVPIEAIGENGDRIYVLDEGFRKGRRSVSGIEAVALNVGQQLLGFVRGTELHRSLEGLRDKLALAPDAVDVEQTLADRIVFWSEPYRTYGEEDNPHLKVILWGLVHRQELELSYQGPRRPSEYRRVRPLALVIYRRALYLMFHIGKEPKVWRLAVDRITAARWTDAEFDYPRGFDVRAELARTFGIYDDGREPPATVRLRFDADAAHLVHERVWHPGATVTDEDDGRVVLEMFANGRELVRLVLEWGPKVEVLEPEWLRREVVASLRAAIDRYDVR